MGLGESEASIDKGSAVACSICLEVVTGGGDRSTAMLQCGHEFHLDCIGSAFNAKGVMQCPNCRKVEKGNWLYANGSRTLPETSFDEWTHDEDLYDFSYTEMTFGIHWCPFNRLARLPSSFEEGESSPAVAFQDLIGYHAMFTGNSATSLPADPSSYLGFLQPHQTSASLDPPTFSESHSDRWNHVSGPPEDWNHVWDHHIAPYSRASSRNSGSHQGVFSSTNVPAVMVDSDGLSRAGLHPLFLGHGSNSRLAGSFGSPLVPPFLANSRPHGHVRMHHYPPAPHGTMYSDSHRQGPANGLPPVGPTPPTLPDQATYYLFPPTASSSRSRQDVESAGDHFYSWERDRFTPFPLMPVPVDREWRPFPHSSSSSDSGGRVGFWHRNSSDRPSSQARTDASSHRPPHSTRTRPHN